MNKLVIYFVFGILSFPLISSAQGTPTQAAKKAIYTGNNLLKIAGDQYTTWTRHAEVLKSIGFHPVDTIGRIAPEVYWSDAPEGSLIFKVADKPYSDDQLSSIIITDKSTMDLPFGLTWGMDFEAVLNAVNNIKGAFNITSSKTSFPEVEFSYQNSAVLSSVVKVHWEQDKGIVHNGRYLEIFPAK